MRSEGGRGADGCMERGVTDSRATRLLRSLLNIQSLQLLQLPLRTHFIESSLGQRRNSPLGSTIRSVRCGSRTKRHDCCCGDESRTSREGRTRWRLRRVRGGANGIDVSEQSNKHQKPAGPTSK